MSTRGLRNDVLLSVVGLLLYLPAIGRYGAKLELLLFFAALIQKFKFEIPKEDQKPSLEHVAGITMQPSARQAE